MLFPLWHQEVSYQTRLRSCSITTSLEPGSVSCLPVISANKPLLSRCLQGLSSAPLLHTSITSGPAFAVHQLQVKLAPASLLHQGGGQQHPGNSTEAASLTLGEGQAWPSFHPRQQTVTFSSCPNQAAWGWSKTVARAPICTNAFSHIHQALLPESIYHFWLLVQPSKKPEPEIQRSSGLQPWPSHPSIPTHTHSLAAPVGQTQT